jgi:hypothetical protein
MLCLSLNYSLKYEGSMPSKVLLRMETQNVLQLFKSLLTLFNVSEENLTVCYYSSFHQIQISFCFVGPFYSLKKF